jgi:NADH-quinone oxidoreductase subunit A
MNDRADFIAFEAFPKPLRPLEHLRRQQAWAIPLLRWPGHRLRSPAQGAFQGPIERPSLRMAMRVFRLDKDEATMTGVLADYLPLVIFVGISLVIGIALLVAPFVVAYSSPDAEKLSAYECGFNAFDDARMKFDVRFYLVAILFIIFDLEVAFLFPWAVAFGQLGWFGFWSMMTFLAVLTVGFVYEWKKGALDWD